MVKKLEGIAKKKLDSALRQRHSQPELAARNLMELLYYVPADVVWQNVRKVSPTAVEELQAILRTHQVGNRAS